MLKTSALRAEIEKKKRKQNIPDVDNGEKKYRRNGDEEVDSLRKKIEEEKNKRKKEEEECQKQDKIEADDDSVNKKKPYNDLLVEEVIRRLRKHGEPITFFGETDQKRCERLQRLEEHEKSRLNEEDKLAGTDNDFRQDLEQASHVGSTIVQDEKPIVEESDTPKTRAPDQSKGDFLLENLKRWLKTWEQDLNDRPEDEKLTAQGRVIAATFRQCCRYIEPLFQLLENKKCPTDILNPLYEITVHLKNKQYVKASDAYLRLAIGNAPWPMGVTMVGIHERSAREKIFTNQVAHILNDETQRKYIQSIKRIITYCQNRWPVDPSQTVGWR